MKYLFIVFLVLNFLAEMMAAVSLVAGPAGIAAAGSGGQWSMHYGFGALAFASASLWLWPQRNHLAAVTAVLGILLVFHSGLLVSLILAGDQPVGVGIHGLLAPFCALLFFTRKSWCGTQPTETN